MRVNSSFHEVTRTSTLHSLLDFTSGLSAEELCIQIGEVNTITALGRREFARCLFDMQHPKVKVLWEHTFVRFEPLKHAAPMGVRQGDPDARRGGGPCRSTPAYSPIRTCCGAWSCVPHSMTLRRPWPRCETSLAGRSFLGDAVHGLRGRIRDLRILLLGVADQEGQGLRHTERAERRDGHQTDLLVLVRLGLL